MFLHIQPHDPLISRDSRPFQSGGRVKSLNWIYPGVTTGSIRTLLGKSREGTQSFTPEIIEELLALEFTGPFPVSDEKLYLPVPQDVVLYEDKKGQRQQMVLKPAALPEGCGANLPDEKLWPLNITQDIKAIPNPAFWSFDLLSRWLLSDPQTIVLSESNAETLEPFLQEERMHVEINPMSSTAEEGRLFSTTGLVFPDLNGEGLSSLGIALKLRGQIPQIQELESNGLFHPIGGERRLSHIRATKQDLWKTPANAREKLSACKGLRMYLASPALFNKGWLPDWLDSSTLEGCLPGTNLNVRLRSACLTRWQAVSGWSLKDRGPKPLRRMVPAGSIYFFECLSGDSSQLADHWFQSVSDIEQDRRDGFGTALWGTWNIE